MADKPSSAKGPGAVERVTRREPVTPPEAAAPVAPARPAEAVAKTAKAAPVAPAAKAQAVAGVAPIPREEVISSIASRLRGGTLTVSAAIDELIEDAVQRNAPGAQEVADQLRQALQAHMQGDPILLSRMRRLERSKKR